MGILVHNFYSTPRDSLTSRNRISLGSSSNQAPSSKRNLIFCKTAKFPQMSAIQQNTDVEQQKLVIPNKYGEKLVGLLHETGSKEIVILCHGFRSSKENRSMTNLAVALGKAGISAFRFDFAGNGESEGSFQYGNYYREADDLHSVIQRFTDLNRKVVAILGHSKGGNVVLLYASKYGDVYTVINLSGRYDLQKGVKERLGIDVLERIKQQGFILVKDKSRNVKYRVTEDSLMDRLSTDMYEACRKINEEIRVITIHGSGDEIVPVEDAKEFAKIIPNHKLHIVEGADHSFSQHQSELESVVLDFIQTTALKSI